MNLNDTQPLPRDRLDRIHTEHIRRLEDRVRQLERENRRLREVVARAAWRKLAKSRIRP